MKIGISFYKIPSFVFLLSVFSRQTETDNERARKITSVVRGASEERISKILVRSHELVIDKFTFYRALRGMF